MLRTSLSFSDPRTGIALPSVFRDTIVLSSYRDFGSARASVEVGVSRAFDADDVIIRGHLVALNIGDDPVDIETRDGRPFERERLPPAAIFVRPAGTTLRQRNHGKLRWAAVELPAPAVERVLGAPVSVEPACGLVDEPLARLIRAMVAETTSGCPTGPLYADGLIAAFAARLAHLAGRPAPPPARGRPLDAARLARIRDLVEASLGKSLAVADLAAAAGLSVAHFAREFRRATGQTPHAFVMGHRLERARQLLAAGHRPAEVAIATGFADQAHLSRTFRGRFGVTPGAFARRPEAQAGSNPRRRHVQDDGDDDGQAR